MKKDYLALVSLTSLTVMAGLIMSSTRIFADGVIDVIDIDIPVSCSMESSGEDSHSDSIINGTYTDDIGSTTIDVFCNDSNGFAIYAIGFTGDQYEGDDHTKLIGSYTNEKIITGTATTAGNPDVSNWAMKLATDSNATYTITLDNSFDAYHAVPSTYTKVAHRDAATDVGVSATGAELTTTYAAYISRSQPADTYNGKVKYTLVHPADEVPLQPQPCQAGKICYHPNANPSVITGEMGKQSASNGASVTLYASNYKRDGYGFAGWNDKFDYTGNFYGPNQTITLTTADYSTKGLSLYAVWVKSTGSLQDSTKVATLCGTGTGSLTQDPNDGTADLTTVTALTDERDNNTYAIAKLADGKCWMIENLRLADKDSNNNDIILSSQNTHNPSLPLNNSWYYNNQQGTLTTSNHLSATSDPTSTNPDTAWCQTDSSDCDNQSMVATNNTTLYTNNTAQNYSASGNVYSYGNYYNWYSATAGHGKYGSSSGSGYNAPGDICPAGWRLPTGTTGEFYALNTAINSGTTDSTASNKLRSYPNSFVYSGVVNNSRVAYRYSYGRYWSVSAYYMHLAGDHVSPGMAYEGKYVGKMVRCVSGV